MRCPFGYGRLRLQDVRALGTDLGFLGTDIKNKDEQRAVGLLREKAEQQKAENTTLGTFHSKKQEDRHQCGTQDKSEMGCPPRGASVAKAAEVRLRRKGLVASKTQRGQGTESAVHGKGATLDFARAAAVQARDALARRNWHT